MLPLEKYLHKDIYVLINYSRVTSGSTHGRPSKLTQILSSKVGRIRIDPDPKPENLGQVWVIRSSHVCQV